MTETWQVRTEYTDTQGWDANAALAWDAAFAIVNEAAGHVLDVRKLAVDMNHGVNAALGMAGPTELRNITAIVGGVDLPALKHRSSESDLPAAVKIVAIPDQVTTNGLHRRFLAMPGGLRQIFAATLNIPRVKCEVGRVSIPTVFQRVDPASEQSIILREGQGVALYGPADGGFVHDMRLFCCLRTSGGASYSLNGSFGSVGPGRAIFAIFNGSGSGVVLELISLTVKDEAEYSAQFYPKYRIVQGRMKVLGGEDLTALRMVSSASNLPAGVIMKRHCYLRLPDLTMPWDAPFDMYTALAEQRNQFQVVFAQNRVAGRVFDWQRPQRAPFAFLEQALLVRGRQSASQGFRLRYGEGLAVVYGSGQTIGIVPSTADVLPTTNQNFDIVCTFTREDAVGAVYPDENDVDVTAPAYGPTGTELTGDLVQPVVGDVKSGVQYGADGTEFTGTYVGGGGGATASPRPRFGGGLG